MRIMRPKNWIMFVSNFALSALALAVLLTVTACQTPAPKPEAKLYPQIIAHRGASGHLPEHTLEAYRLGIQSYADFIEPDLVITKDGVLIVRHENELSDTTDVAKKFPKRKKTKTIEGKKVTGWFSEDFTLKEIKTLKARQRFEFRDQDQNGKFDIPSFEQVLQLLAQIKSEPHGLPLGKPVGIYPEIKHPKYFRDLGLPLEEKAVELLKKYGYSTKADPAIIQSFEVDSLERLRKLTDLRLLRLFEDQAITDQELQKTVALADGIGPSKRQILPENPNGTLAAPTDLVKRAHALNLFVHPYTFRSDKNFLNPAYGEDAVQEYMNFFKLGVDGIFSDFPEDAAKARETWLAK